MNCKIFPLLLSCLIIQLSHSSFEIFNKYKREIISAGCFALAEYGISRLKEPQSLISSIKINVKKLENNPIGEFIYLIMTYKDVTEEQQKIIYQDFSYKSSFSALTAVSFFHFHELLLTKHKNYTRSFNVQSSLFYTFKISSLKFQDRLKLFSFCYLPITYCNLENSPLFFADSNLHRTISNGLPYIFNQQLTSKNLINDKLDLKKLTNHEYDPILLQYKQALIQSFAFCRAFGILKNPFPNAYHFLPKNITHYAHQPNLKGKITLLGIDVFQKIGYLFFVRYILFNALAIINDYAAQPVADFCIKKPLNENQEKIKKMLCLCASGVIILFCCEKILQRLYQNLNIRP